MPSFLQPDLQQILSQTLSFFLLLWVLRRVAWKPLLGILDARRAQIERELSEAAQAKVQLAQLQADITKRLAVIEDEARVKLQQAILEGKRIGIEVQEQARAQAQHILTKAKDTVELELAKARTTLRNQVAAMTVEAVEKVLGHKLDAQADAALVNAALDELERPARP